MNHRPDSAVRTVPSAMTEGAHHAAPRRSVSPFRAQQHAARQSVGPPGGQPAGEGRLRAHDQRARRHEYQAEGAQRDAVDGLS
ncbi:hypothetical protein [[Kitasatospora] papulosa]|uniref:hypothetical protein n=1 Tax=[Kitasatospora] papulosa TaxID=1464011 RepID=UPI0036356A03